MTKRRGKVRKRRRKENAEGLESLDLGFILLYGV